MKQLLLLVTLVLTTLLFALFVAAQVGVGMSPSKIVLEGTSGDVLEQSVLVFNSGDQLMKLRFSADGEIASFTTFSQQELTVEPEPQPHALPIKHGQSFTAQFKLPVSGATKKYSGTISASGGPTAGSQFGGTVGVGALVEIIVHPPASPLAFVTGQHLLIGVVVVIVILVLVFLRKAGWKMKFEPKKKDGTL
jgi:hypothetical protein